MHIHLQLISRESSLLLVKCSFVVCVCNLIVTSCQGSVFVFMDMHSVTSAYLFMHVGKIYGVIWSLLLSLTLNNCTASCPLLLSSHRLLIL